MIVLHEGRVHAMISESIVAKGLGKEAAGIAKSGRRQEQYVRDLKPFNLHRRFLIEFPVFSETAGSSRGVLPRQQPEPPADTGPDSGLQMRASKQEMVAQVLVIDDYKTAAL
jgi:hypothetical protein